MKDKIHINPIQKFLMRRFILSNLKEHSYCVGNIKSTYHINHFLHEEKTFHPLIKKILQSSKKFFDKELIIVCMWANVGGYKSKTLRHNHIDNFATDLFKQKGISGSFYLSKSKNSGNFITDEKIISVDQGDILFFSPHLFHSTEINKSNKKRIVISFNGYLM